ncbi:L-asparaginase [Desulfotomaculum arcticum]|uniref:asparaginase n=1 Tax=Desulfotruncus arcticus DSM 17038 TaxID=1121424 RepID=A0A1I2VG92_9FIRM|nr:asparaginase [Desulfotruncus arcticus]SFG88170.1 L-asparaginase [Desulfotomaculum arcticum] [Desulfotruncus arcticus DSM 17038]
MKKILLLATGGTIASIPAEEGLIPRMTAEELISFLPKEHLRNQIDSKVLMTIDSINMQPEFWVKIAQAVYEHYDNYDGFIITHGTDTMAYTSAALSYMLQNIAKPVVLTGSQVPIIRKRTDGIRNFLDAICFASEDIGGVFVVFDGKVIIGTRAMKLRTKSYDAFESINFPYIAYINGLDVKYNKPVRPVKHGGLKLDISLCPDVFLLKLHPGTKPELFDCFKHLYKGVIFESFGTGGVPFQERNLLPKIHELIDSGVSVVTTTQCLQEGEDLGLYEAGWKVAQKMIISSRDMNTEAIVPKLMWALGQTDNPKEVKKIMETPVAYDIANPKEKMK